MRKKRYVPRLRARRFIAVFHEVFELRSLSMSSRSLATLTRMIAGLLTGLLFAFLAVPLGAQTVPESRAARGFGPGYDAAHETTLNGAIQEVVTQHAIGSPAGMHLLVAGPSGVVDAHLGSRLSKETAEALHVGTPVRIVGATVLLHGKEYFLARQLTFGGHTVTIRTSNGLPVYPDARRIVKVAKTAKVETRGGAR